MAGVCPRPTIVQKHPCPGDFSFSGNESIIQTDGSSNPVLFPGCCGSCPCDTRLTCDFAGACYGEPEAIDVSIPNPESAVKECGGTTCIKVDWSIGGTHTLTRSNRIGTVWPCFSAVGKCCDCAPCEYTVVIPNGVTFSCVILAEECGGCCTAAGEPKCECSDADTTLQCVDITCDVLLSVVAGADWAVNISTCNNCGDYSDWSKCDQTSSNATDVCPDLDPLPSGCSCTDVCTVPTPGKWEVEFAIAKSNCVDAVSKDVDNSDPDRSPPLECDGIPNVIGTITVDPGDGCP